MGCENYQQDNLDILKQKKENDAELGRLRKKVEELEERIERFLKPNKETDEWKREYNCEKA